MKRVVQILAAAGIATIVAAATSPFWVGKAIRSVGKSRGLDFAEYERVGYSRFALKDATFETDGVKVSVGRIEAETPMIWLLKKWTGQARLISAADWKVDVEPVAEETQPSDDAGDQFGAMDLRQLLVKLAPGLEQWLRHAELGKGSVSWEGGGLEIDSAVWKGMSLSVTGLRIAGLEGNVEVDFREADSIKVLGNLKDGEGRVEISARAESLQARITLWDQEAGLSARFADEGWMPQSAELNAAGWRVGGVRLGLGEFYPEVRGDLRIEWTGDEFAVHLEAEGDPLADSAAPKLHVQLKGRGDLHSISIEQLLVEIPGVIGLLGAPAEFDWNGTMISGPSTFTLDADLAKLPWFEAIGQIKGEAKLTPRGNAPPLVVAKLEGDQFEWNSWSLPRGSAEAELDWPLLKFRAKTTGDESINKVEAAGSLNLKTDQLTEVKASGEIDDAIVQVWLPDNVSFEKLKFEVEVAGSLSAPEHSGATEVTGLVLPGVRPLAVEASWKGVGAAANIEKGIISAGSSEISFSGEMDSESVRFAELRFSQGGAERLSLDAPASIRFSDDFEVESLALTGSEGSVAMSVTWGRSGRFDLSTKGFKSEWLKDFVEMPDVSLAFESLETRGEWEDGPMNVSANAGFSVAIGDDQFADVRVHLEGDGDGLQIVNMQVMQGGTPVFSMEGMLPVTLRPGSSNFLVVDDLGSVSLEASSASSPEFWGKLRELTGLELVDPLLSIKLEGTWAEPQGEVRVTASRISADSEKFAFRIPRMESLEVHATADADSLDLEQFSMKLEDQSVIASGSVRLGPGSWSELKSDPRAFLRRASDLRVEIPDARIAGLQAFVSPYLAPEGRLKVDAHFKSGGEIEGMLSLSGASTRPLGPLGILQEINAEIAFSGRTAELQNVSAKAGGQPVSLTGKVSMPEGRPLEFDLSLKGSNLPFARRSGLLVRGDLDLKLSTGADGIPLISGTARLRDSLYLSDIRALLPSGSQGPSRRPPYFAVESAPLNTWKLGVDVRGEKFLRMRTTLFNGVASARFRLAGTLGEPRATGAATINEGEVLLPFATFDVQQGSVRLTEAEPYSPRLMIVGTSRLQGYDLRMELSGTATDPQLTFTSSPALPSDELLAMVMAGEAPQTAEGYEAGNRRYARLGAYVGRSLLRSFGGNSADAERLSITTGANISRLGRETYEIEYKLNQRYSLAGEYDEFDEFNAGVKWRFFSDKGVGSGNDDDKGESSDESLAEISVDGLGWFGNREQRRSLQRLLGDQWGETLGTNAIEDASILLLSAVNDQGYLNASLQIDITTGEGPPRTFTFDRTLSTTLPRPLAARSVTFRVDRGPRHVVEEVKISGLSAIPTATARAFFLPNAFLLQTESERVYTPARLSRSVDRLLDELRMLGYAEADVSVDDVAIDESSGRVTLAVSVTEGPRWQVEELRVTGVPETVGEMGNMDRFAGQAWSRRWQQDVREAARRVLYEKGFPDVALVLSEETGVERSGVKPVVATLSIDPGQQVRVGEVRFEGAERTRDSVLRRSASLGSGELLDPLKIERTRLRLSRLGVFDSVESQLEPEDGPVRDAVFLLKEGRRWDGELLLGYGSYEQLRLGASIRHLNFFGLAHQGRLSVVQSMKSSRGELSYTVPELFGESIDGTARLFGLRREETSFVRTETGLNVSLKRPVEQISGEASLGYTFQSLRNRDNELGTAPIDNQDVTVGSVDFALTSDTRDNPLRPRRGFRLFGRVENAMKLLGGESDFQRLVVGGSYHTSWGGGRWIHVGLSHGVLTTLGSDDDSLLPVNKRFFPGGDASIRGYQNGEASPRDAEGKFIGAKTYLQANLELEQAVTGNWTIVAFFDAIGVAARLEDYPFDEKLYSAGLGVRYQTLIGPVRLEYGHNLNPREDDPSGTLHLSVGFPF